MTRRGLTTEELRASNLVPCRLAEVLRDEERRGNVERRGEEWVATEGLVRAYGQAFAYVQPPQREKT